MQGILKTCLTTSFGNDTPRLACVRHWWHGPHALASTCAFRSHAANPSSRYTGDVPCAMMGRTRAASEASGHAPRGRHGEGPPSWITRTASRRFLCPKASGTARCRHMRGRCGRRGDDRTPAGVVLREPRHDVGHRLPTHRDGPSPSLPLRFPDQWVQRPQKRLRPFERALP